MRKSYDYYGRDRSKYSADLEPDAEQSELERKRRQRIITAPPILLWVLGLIWFFVAAMAIAPGWVFSRFETVFALSATQFLAGPEANGGIIPMFAPLIGHMFIHADLVHAGMNSLWFLAFGAPVYRRFATGGMTAPGFPYGDNASDRLLPGVAFLLFFLLSGVFGALFFIFLNIDQGALLVGASGGVSGLLGGLVRIISRRGPMFSRGFRPLARLTDGTVIIWSAVITIMNIAVGVFGFGLGENGPNVAWEAHIGGYFAGLLLFPIFDRVTKRGGA